MNRAIVLLVAAACLAGGAALPVNQARPQVSVPAPWQPVADNAPERKRLFYIGLALWPESWSQNDVVELGNELRQTTSFEVVPLIASNFAAASRPANYPIADDAVIAQLVNAAAERIRPGDIVFVHISTHGAPGLLACEIDDRAPTVITSRALARALAPLAGLRSVIVLSACYSGSLIGVLRDPDRIIITAARSDRSSFGCAAGNRHTLFGEAELHAFARSGRSLRQVFAAIRGDVAHMERAQRVTPSEPQVSVGHEVSDLYEAPVF